MTAKVPFIQLAENCIVCALPLNREEHPIGVSDVRYKGILATVVHKECGKFIRPVLLHRRLASNAAQWADYALPLLDAEALAREQRKNSRSLQPAVVAQRKAENAFERAKQLASEAVAVAQDNPGMEHLQVDADELHGRYQEAWAALVQSERELDAALVAAGEQARFNHDGLYSVAPTSDV